MIDVFLFLSYSYSFMILDDFFRHKKSRECYSRRQRKQPQKQSTVNNKERLEDMSSLVQSNFLSNSSKDNLQLETDEAAVISLLANQLSQQQTQLTGPVLQDEGKSIELTFQIHTIQISKNISFRIENIEIVS